jgi:hypothetical protein
LLNAEIAYRHRKGDPFKLTETGYVSQLLSEDSDRKLFYSQETRRGLSTWTSCTPDFHNVSSLHFYLKLF